MVRAAGFSLVVVALALSAACKGKSTEEKVAEREQALAAAKKEQKEAAAKPEARLDRPADPYWDDASFVVLKHEGPCPEGLWALFKGKAPGGDDAARGANEAQRAQLASAFSDKTFVARLRGPDEVNLKEYDAPKNQFPLELKGTIDCEDSIGRVAFSFTEVKAVNVPTSALDEGQNPQMMWSAPPRAFTVGMKSQSDAKSFAQKHRFGMEAYIVFKIAKTEVHRKMIKTAKQTQGEVTIGGTTDDYGAGRLIRADVQGIRVLANPGPIVVIDTKDPAKVSLK